MRKFLIIAPVVIIFLTLSVVAAGTYLAYAGPIPSSSFFYPLQDIAEQKLVLVYFRDPVSRTHFYLDLVGRRIDNLHRAAGSDGELPAIEALDQALTRAVSSLSEMNDSDAADLRARLAEMVSAIQVRLSDLTVLPVLYNDIYLAFVEKVNALQDGLENNFVTNQELRFLTSEPIIIGKEDVARTSLALAQFQVEPTVLPPQMVPFPDGSSGVLHEFFPLVGEHASLLCSDCHVDYQYLGAPTECLACHQVDEPQNHYPLACVYCHNPFSWQDVRFNHGDVNTSDCSLCHFKDKPPNHYNGICSACHITSGWLPATFNHAVAGATNCTSCHTVDKPSNHYSGQCSACHSTEAWKPATFNHEAAGATNCLDCHINERPPDHFDGQCTPCHSTNKWKPAFFDHGSGSFSDCLECHVPDRPNNHWDGQCSLCHNSDKWKPANFNHEATGAIDCIACHNNKIPDNHWEGQCSLCHNTEKWKPAVFNHSAAGAIDCIACHIDDRPNNHAEGQCSLCHNTEKWKPAFFNHEAAGATNCVGCHLEDAPDEHFTTQCSGCHNTNNWPNINFVHTFPFNHHGAKNKCLRCHVEMTPPWTCETCHEMSKMVPKHEEWGIIDIPGRCLECHPTGENP